MEAKIAVSKRNRITVNLGEGVTEIYRPMPILSISQDGVPLVPDEKKNVEITVNLNDINAKLDDFLNTKTVKHAFAVSDFAPSGRQFKLTIPLEKHKRGFNAFVESVYKDNGENCDEVLCQAYMLPNGTVVIRSDSVFDGHCFIKGTTGINGRI